MTNQDIFDMAHKVPIVEVVKQYVELRPYSGRFCGLCPFHNDTSVGSFFVFPEATSEKRGWFQCYACGAKGDNIDFVQQYLNVSYREAAVIIAENAGIIHSSDAEALKRKGNVAPPMIICRKMEQEPLKLAKKRSVEHLDKVYRCFVAAADPLTPETREMLLTERKIPENSLWKYFLFPVRDTVKNFWPKFLSLLSITFGVSNETELANLLTGVPGFFWGKHNFVTFLPASEARIGILILDRHGWASGIQTRTLVSGNGNPPSKWGKKKRYRFFSSGYANGTKDAIGSYGCSCGFVEDVLFPADGKWNHVIAITEGRFKAETLSSLGFLVVDMHSISNWKFAGQVALDLAEKTKAKQFVLCYDREENCNVEQSAAGIYGMLSPILVTEFATWDPSYGKGIDDVINSGNIRKISRVAAQEYFMKKPENVCLSTF